MTKNIMALVSLAIFASLVLGAAGAWRRRSRNQSAVLSKPLEALDYFGELIAQSRAFYVATTFANNLLERVSAHGLGSRGVANIFLFTEGVLIIRNGEIPLAIPGHDITAIGTTQVAIDKAVERDGLIVITWNNDGTNLSTVVRIADEAERVNLLHLLETEFSMTTTTPKKETK